MVCSLTKEGYLSFATAWMNVEDIMLSEINTGA